MTDFFLKQLPSPCVMGIINCSSDSFFNAIPSLSKALKKVETMVRAGVSIVDVGAIATNPQIQSINTMSAEQESEKLIPFIEAIAKRFDVFISADTAQPLVMRNAIESGADMINDQQGLRSPESLNTIVELNVPVCIMHAFKTPRQPDSCTPSQLLNTILRDLRNTVSRCLTSGVRKNQIMIDPGFGARHFGKSAQENLFLLSKLDRFKSLKLPILVGLSRKSLFGDLMHLPVDKRLNVSVIAATIAAMKGAAIIRAHDVAETVQAMTLIQLLNKDVA